jgi:hypothetical protein
VEAKAGPIIEQTANSGAPQNAENGRNEKAPASPPCGTNVPLLSFTHMAQRHRPLQLAADLGAAVLDTSVTLWWRWPIFLAAGMTSRDSAELNRMVSEKVAAATSGTVAAQTETMRIASRALTGKKTPHAATAVVAAALKPALRTVKANAKRLGKKRRSALR